MIVPKEIAPVDYNKNTNQFIFLLDNFILSIDYQNENFELQTPENIVYNEAFTLLESPPKWLEDIEFGVIDWVKLAINWNNQVQKKGKLIKTTISADGIVYNLEYNPSNFDFSLEIPGKTIISHPNSLFYNFPEFRLMDNGELISLLTAEICYQTQGLDLKPSDRRIFNAPITFHPKKVSTSRNNYGFEFLMDYDLVFLAIPTRQIHTNMLTIELDSLELSEMHDGKMIEAIRNVVHEKSLSA